MTVVDSSALIHLSRIGKLELLKTLFKHVAITKEIVAETTQKNFAGALAIENALNNWILVSEPRNATQVKEISSMKGIEPADASIIVLALERREALLSNDFALIRLAESLGIECLWITTFILKCVKQRIVTKEEAKDILFQLVSSGMRLSIEVYAELQKKIDELPTQNTLKT